MNAEEREKLRKRLCGHTRRLYVEMEFASQRAMATAMHIDEGHLSAVMSGAKDAGVDFVAGLARIVDQSIKMILTVDPDPKWFPPKYEPRPRRPRAASLSPRSERRRKIGGK